MAGIGFVLRKLVRKNNLSGIIQAYLHATLASSGPWLFTVIALGSFFLLTSGYLFQDATENFRVIVLYNFSFSLVLSSPLSIISTRYLADMIYEEYLDDVCGMLFGSLICLFALGLPAILAFYLRFSDMHGNVLFLAAVNFLLISSIWQASIFISAVKQYMAISLSFIVGLTLAVLAGFFLADPYGLSGMLAGFNVGLGLVLASLIALVLAEYPLGCRHVFRVLRYFKKHWQLALGSLAYSLGIWVDKWLMWFAPEAIALPNGLAVFPHYDSAMFVAYLTVLPALAMFLITQETAFFEEYLKFFNDIQRHANFQKIQRNHESMQSCIAYNGMNLLLLQGCIGFLVVLSAPKILQLTGMNFIQLGIFRFGVMGAAFQVFTLFLIVLLTYFDNKKGVLCIQVFFFLSNGLLTALTIHLGFAWYGYGYFLSTLLTFLLATAIAERYVRKLPYYAFVVNNSSVEY